MYCYGVRFDIKIMILQWKIMIVQWKIMIVCGRLCVNFGYFLGKICPGNIHFAFKLLNVCIENAECVC